MDVKKKTTLEMNAEFPSLAEGAQSTKAPKHSKKESKKSSKGHSMPLQQFLTQSAPASNNNILSSANTSAVPKHNGYSQKVRYLQYICRLLDHELPTYFILFHIHTEMTQLSCRGLIY